jgi:hypothetical protein
VPSPQTRRDLDVITCAVMETQPEPDDRDKRHGATRPDSREGPKPPRSGRPVRYSVYGERRTILRALLVRFLDRNPRLVQSAYLAWRSEVGRIDRNRASAKLRRKVTSIRDGVIKTKLRLASTKDIGSLFVELSRSQAALLRVVVGV